MQIQHIKYLREGKPFDVSGRNSLLLPILYTYGVMSQYLTLYLCTHFMFAEKSMENIKESICIRNKDTGDLLALYTVISRVLANSIILTYTKESNAVFIR